METKMDVLQANYKKLDDICNSIESIMEKIGVLQVDLFENPDNELEKDLQKISDLSSDAFMKVKQVKEDYIHKHQMEI